MFTMDIPNGTYVCYKLKVINTVKLKENIHKQRKE